MSISSIKSGALEEGPGESYSLKAHDIVQRAAEVVSHSPGRSHNPTRSRPPTHVLASPIARVSPDLCPEFQVCVSLCLLDFDSPLGHLKGILNSAYLRHNSCFFSPRNPVPP